MTTAEREWRIGIVGLGSMGLFLLEQLTLQRQIRLMGAFDRCATRRPLATNSGCPFWDDPKSVLTSDDVDVVFITDELSAHSVNLALQHQKHVVIDRPWLLSADELSGLDRRLETETTGLTVTPLQNWSADFAAAKAALTSGRLGTLTSLRFSSCERGLPSESSNFNLLREVGFARIVQLLSMVDALPRRVFARRHFETPQKNEVRFFATIEFANGCSGELEIDSQSRLSFRTGWMLEGTTGSFRRDRLYTDAPDGEIIDEPSPKPLLENAQSSMQHLMSVWRGDRSERSSINLAARAARLLEALEKSAATGQVIELQGAFE